MIGLALDSAGPAAEMMPTATAPADEQGECKWRA